MPWNSAEKVAEHIVDNPDDNQIDAVVSYDDHLELIQTKFTKYTVGYTSQYDGIRDIETIWKKLTNDGDSFKDPNEQLNNWISEIQEIYNNKTKTIELVLLIPTDVTYAERIGNDWNSVKYKIENSDKRKNVKVTLLNCNSLKFYTKPEQKIDYSKFN